jgi:hypothetical protein
MKDPRLDFLGQCVRIFSTYENADAKCICYADFAQAYRPNLIRLDFVQLQISFEKNS